MLSSCRIICEVGVSGYEFRLSYSIWNFSYLFFGSIAIGLVVGIVCAYVK